MVQLSYLECLAAVLVIFGTGMLLQTKIYDIVVHGHERALRRHIARFRRGMNAKIDAFGLRPGDDPQELPNYVWHGSTVVVIDFLAGDRALVRLPTGDVAAIGLVLLRPVDEKDRSVPRGTTAD